MADRRRHRGAHPEDAELFADDRLLALQTAVEELSWLLSHGYSVRSALVLVGDHWNLRERQRIAVRRCACSDLEREERLARSASPELLHGATVWIDGFNVLTTLEAALGGGILLLARDGALRDMASMHGSYRSVEETRPAIQILADVLESHGVQHCRWLLDSPVSNSGRLRATFVEIAASRGLPWDIVLVRDVDRALEEAPPHVIVASADSHVMDRASRHWQLARTSVERIRPSPRIIDLTKRLDAVGPTPAL